MIHGKKIHKLINAKPNPVFIHFFCSQSLPYPATPLYTKHYKYINIVVYQVLLFIYSQKFSKLYTAHKKEKFKPESHEIQTIKKSVLTIKVKICLIIGWTSLNYIYRLTQFAVGIITKYVKIKVLASELSLKRM